MDWDFVRKAFSQPDFHKKILQFDLEALHKNRVNIKKKMGAVLCLFVKFKKKNNFNAQLF